jgi:CRISPR-associated endoribonuclease Cas6
MRIKISMESHGGNHSIRVPRHYNYLIQGFIYKNLDSAIAARVHDRGYAHGKRRFRLFTFSRLHGQFTMSGDQLVFNSKCVLWIASPITEILESFACSLARKGRIKLGNVCCQISSIEVPFTAIFEPEVLIRVLSPITIYSTIFTKNRRKKTYYYTPFEQEFSSLIKENLLKKYTVLNGSEDKDLAFSIMPEKVSKRNEHVIMYKDTVIKAWSGIYRITGTPELIKTAFDCGLGSKNPQGFGMIEKWEPRQRSEKVKKNE